MKKEDKQETFIFFSERMINKMTKDVIKKGLQQDFVNRAKQGLRDKSIIW